MSEKVLAHSAAVLQAADKTEQKITRELSLAAQQPIFDWLESTWDVLFSDYFPNNPYGKSANFCDQQVLIPDLFRIIDNWILCVYDPPRGSQCGFSGTVRYLVDSLSYDERHIEKDCLICQRKSTNWPLWSDTFFTWLAGSSKGIEPTVAQQMVNAQSLVGGLRG